MLTKFAKKQHIENFGVFTHHLGHERHFVNTPFFTAEQVSSGHPVHRPSGILQGVSPVPLNRISSAMDFGDVIEDLKIEPNSVTFNAMELLIPQKQSLRIQNKGNRTIILDDVVSSSPEI
jgi:hypothetical protein